MYNSTKSYQIWPQRLDLYVIPYTLSVTSKSAIDAIQIRSPFSINFQRSFFQNLNFSAMQ